MPAQARDWESAVWPARLKELRAVKVTTEVYEDGKKIISVDTAEEFSQILHDMDNYRVEIEAREEVIEALGIFDSAEELGIDPDTVGTRGRAWRVA